MNYLRLRLRLDAFLDKIPKTQVIIEKIDKVDFIKIKNLCASRETIKKVKRQLTE